MVWKCQNPGCGFENEDGEDYCIKCGLKKGAGVEQPGIPSVQPSPEPVIAPAPEIQPAPVIQAPEARLQMVKSSFSLANEFSVTNGKSLGRAIDNDIVLPDTYVSRKHAKISFENGVYVIEDLSSTNGTFLNGDNIQGKGKQPLKDEDELRVGTTVFKFKQS